MADIPSEEVLFCCANALYGAMADHMQDRQRRMMVLDSLQYKDDLAEAPGQVNEFFKQMAERCLTQATAVGVPS